MFCTHKFCIVSIYPSQKRNYQFIVKFTSKSSGNKTFYIGEHNGTKIGVCRFEYNNEKNISEISINLNPNERGKGYGKKLLTNAIKTYLKNKKYNKFNRNN